MENTRNGRSTANMTVSLWGTRGVESSKSKMWVGVAGNSVFCTSLKNVVLIGRLIMNQLNFGATAWPSSVNSFSILHSNCAVTNCFLSVGHSCTDGDCVKEVHWLVNFEC